MYGTKIYTPAGQVLRQSRNLRGMLEYARVSPVAYVQTAKGENPTNGKLLVIYADGCFSTAHFACHSIMIDFVRNRRTWRSARFTHLDGDMGYLTKPGVMTKWANPHTT